MGNGAGRHWYQHNWLVATLVHLWLFMTNPFVLVFSFVRYERWNPFDLTYFLSKFLPCTLICLSFEYCPHIISTCSLVQFIWDCCGWNWKSDRAKSHTGQSHTASLVLTTPSTQRSLFHRLPPWHVVSILEVRFCPVFRRSGAYWPNRKELPPDTRSDEVSKLFDGFGRVVDVRVMTGQ